LRWLHESSRVVVGNPGGFVIGAAGLVVTILSAFHSPIAAAIVAAATLLALTAFVLHGVRVSDLYGPAFAIETIEFKWDFRRRDAGVVVYSKTMDVIYLHSDIATMWDDAWGDGQWTEFSSSEGVPVDSFRAGGREHRIVSLRSRKHRGDRQQFVFAWVNRDGFAGPRQWAEIEVKPNMQNVSVRLLFPDSLLPSSITVEKRNDQRHPPTHVTEQLEPVPEIEDLHQLVWTPPRRRKRREGYWVIEWEWPAAPPGP
jgi:hypothetical protein